MKRLGDAELEIMLAMWEAGKPVTANEILKRLYGSRSWALSTLVTSLNRLGAKGFITCDKSGRNNMYSALIEENDYKAEESSSFLKKLHGDSIDSLVVNLYNGKKINSDDIKSLRDLLDSLDEEEES